MTRSWQRWLGVGVAAAAAAAALRLTVWRGETVEVEVARVERGAVEEVVTNSRAGTVKARRRARLSPQTGGRVLELPYRRGDRVAAGVVVLRLDDTLQRARLALAEREVGSARARAEAACLAAELATRELARGEALRLDGIASEQALDGLASERDRSAAACRAALAGRELAEAQVRLAEAELALTRVEAPFAGVLAEVATEIGEWITPSPPGVPIPPVLDLIDPTSLVVSAPIDEVEAERLAVGQKVRVAVDSRPGQKLDGRVVRVAPFVLDALEQNRTIEIEVELAEQGAAAGLLPGLSADIEVVVARRDGVLRVPTAAVAEGGAVLVLAGGRLLERRIETGMRSWQLTEVRGGVAEGEFVVTRRESTAIKAGVRARARGGA
ncbi:MAG TPA: efflux RND transporter periplasmic adaptor subunit [Thermoanaerobaculaceae bacterium]|nr:efflux RND transporter periplasmic adaptor subunit [Thermoanaerobaculaceae bacterium]HRS15550.1 efflux RND transporter periplasmic adaptor subunit [Thermoanaerobaculaceae bacterium]